MAQFHKNYCATINCTKKSLWHCHSPNNYWARKYRRERTLIFFGAKDSWLRRPCNEKIILHAEQKAVKSPRILYSLHCKSTLSIYMQMQKAELILLKVEVEEEEVRKI